jgi:hypothetical protein
MNQTNNLKQTIEHLYRYHGLIMLKGGTEWEDCVIFFKPISCFNVQHLSKLSNISSMLP